MIFLEKTRIQRISHSYNHFKPAHSPSSHDTKSSLLRVPPSLHSAHIPSLGGLNIPDEDVDDDFGTGAGFYLDATRAPWSDGYRMASYITRDLPDAVFGNFPQIDAERVSITGHSMGGHGALTLVSLNFFFIPPFLFLSFFLSLFLSLFSSE